VEAFDLSPLLTVVVPGANCPVTDCVEVTGLVGKIALPTLWALKTGLSGLAAIPFLEERVLGAIPFLEERVLGCSWAMMDDTGTGLRMP
jgi:hypothetical protein